MSEAEEQVDVPVGFTSSKKRDERNLHGVQLERTNRASRAYAPDPRLSLCRLGILRKEVVPLDVRCHQGKIDLTRL